MALNVLRIRSDVGSTVEVRYDPAKGEPSSALVPFEFQRTPQDQEDLRWYLEDYLRYPLDPGPLIAARVEQNIVEAGRRLFGAVFETTDEAKAIWSRARPGLADTRIEIASDDPEIPWELMRESESAAPAAVLANSFVRTSSVTVSSQEAAPRIGSRPLRILLVIARPGGSGDVPFRSVATRLIQGLRESNTPCECDVLRPPTFEKMQQQLAEARRVGRPYDVVHFDGHGLFVDLNAQTLNVPPDPRRMRGYVVFESSDGEEQYIDGTLFGEALKDGQTPILVLNACRSARSGPAPEPGNASTARSDRPLGSFAQEVSTCGADGVVAMRFNVFVETAAQFVGDMYAALAAGKTLGQAVTAARRRLREDPMRSAGHDPRALQDWCVPEVYEVRPWSIGVVSRETATTPEPLTPSLPATPETGFIGRDIVLLEIERAFDSHAVVLLHGYVGSGKTATAAEFARWYSLTGGISGPVLFSSVEENTGDVLQQRLQESGDLWALWICDGIERLRDAPKQCQKFAELAAGARQSKLKILVTSRGMESDWLAPDLAHRILLGPMTVPDCVTLVRCLVKAHKSGIQSDALAPLIPFSFGNPMTLAGLVARAVHDGISTREQCEALVERLRESQAELTDDPGLRLAADPLISLLDSFSRADQARLSLLCLFQQFVNYEFFRLMGGFPNEPKPDWGLDIMSELSFDSTKDLLDRAAERGLLVKLNEVNYSIHPAACWASRGLFSQFHPGKAAVHAYVKTMVLCSRNISRQIALGNNVLLRAFPMDQANLHHARQLSRRHGWWEDEIAITNSLLLFLQMSQRMEEFSQLIIEMYPLVIDPRTREPLPGRETYAPTMWEHRATCAEHDRDFDTAEALLERAIGYNRERAPAPEIKELSSAQRSLISELAAETYRRGQIRYSRGKGGCMDDYLEAIALCQRIGHMNMAANCALDAGTAWLRLESVRDVDAAERCYLQAAEWLDPRDGLGKAKCYLQLAVISQERLEGAQTKEEVQKAAQSAVSYSFRALPLLPEAAVEERATCHARLGTSFRALGQSAESLEHSQESMRLFDQIDAVRGADARLNIANLLMEQHRYVQSADYIREAIRVFSRLGDSAADQVREAQRRLEWVEKMVGENSAQ